jgi:Holliday junction resolvasome RuvABC endonuclease subunit
MIAVGIDPGLAAMGIAVVERLGDGSYRCRHANTIRTKATDRKRWLTLADGLSRAVYWSPGTIVIEEQSGAFTGAQRTRGTSANSLKALRAGGFAHGFLMSYVCADNPISIDIQPQRAKAAVGCARTATKAQVKRAVRALVKGCPKRLSEHSADAIAIAVAGLQEASCAVKK